VKRPEVADSDPKAWAWRLRKRELELDRLTPFQRCAWREALKTELQAGAAA